MKITFESVKSRLRMVADIETAARACELEKDETNIRYKWLDLALEDMTKIL